MSKTAFITGITGQDGYYLAKLLLEKDYEVHGLVRRNSNMNRCRIDQLKEELSAEAKCRLTLWYGDVTDVACLIHIFNEAQPQEVYHLAAQSHVRISFDKPSYTHAVNSCGALNVLEAARLLHAKTPVRLYQASTSEMFGGLPGTAPQSETTPFHPRSPYATSKLAAFHHTRNYREAYGMFACNGILFNHESPQRTENFVTRKITLAAARIRCGLQSELRLGNLDAHRDWGFAGDYVDAMWRMLQQDHPDDYVVATGQTHTVREFLEHAFRAMGLDWRDHVVIDERFFRPTEVIELHGDASKARQQLGWSPRVSFEELVQMMVIHDLDAVMQSTGISRVDSDPKALPMKRAA